MTHPPGDPWNPPPLPDDRSADRPADHVAGDAPATWTAPAPDPEVLRARLTRSTSLLGRGLNVLAALTVVGGAVSALSLTFGGRAALALLPAAAQDRAGTATALLSVAGLLTLALTGVYASVIRWARELLTRLGEWVHAPDAQPPDAQTPAPDAPRMERLRRTLAGWLVFSQWGNALGVLLSPLLIPFTTRLAERLLDASDPALTDGLVTGPGLVAYQTVSGVVSGIPVAVITWLILGTVLRFMNVAVQRARGMQGPPLARTAQLAGQWFLLSMILLGVLALNLLIVLALVLFLTIGLNSGAMSDSLSFLTPQVRAALGVLPGVLLGLCLYGLGVYLLLFLLLMWSRTYASSLAALLDARPVPAPQAESDRPTTLNGP